MGNALGSSSKCMRVQLLLELNDAPSNTRHSWCESPIVLTIQAARYAWLKCGLPSLPHAIWYHDCRQAMLPLLAQHTTTATFKTRVAVTQAQHSRTQDRL